MSDTKKDTDEISHIGFFERIMHKPRLYTPNGTYEEILSYIWATRFPLALDDYDLEAWDAFCEWLSIDLDLKEPQPALLQFRTRFADGESAKAALLEKMIEFRTRKE
jgi:hypothetical protein